MNTQTKPIKTNIEYVLISCCTCKRPKMLSEALNSIKKINFPENIKVEVLVCDNDATRSGEIAVKEFEQTSEIKIHYVVEEERGIAPARNRVLKEAVNLNASHVLFFDDDEVIEPNCLLEHIKLYETNANAYISSGPAFNTFTKNFPNYIKKNIVFNYSTTKKTGQERETCATNNVFFPVSLVKDYDVYFSLEYKFMGGEDGDFFKRAREKGFTIIWNNEAIIYEMVSEARANLPYVLKRNHYNGFSSGLLKLKEENFNKKRNVYILRNLIIALFYFCLAIPSILLGLTIFFNVISLGLKAKGKFDAVTQNRSLNFYQNISGE